MVSVALLCSSTLHPPANRCAAFPSFPFILVIALYTDLAIRDLFEDPDSDSLVPFVPTEEKVVDAMLEMAGVNAKDLLFDLGCGDGRIVVKAAMERGARAIGVDLDAALLTEAREYAGWSRVDDMVDFIHDDLLSVDFSPASVVTLYLLPMINLKLKPRLLEELRPGTRVISHDFDMGNWHPDEQASVHDARLFLWIVPAPVAGTWTLASGDREYRLELQQEFQRVSGKAWINGEDAVLQSAELRGDHLKLQIQSPDADQPEQLEARWHRGELELLGTTSG